ncbi:MAG: cation transporter, partial [Calditrichaeota bacterium]|nr:cation transporter [Calditrichota bacterium]
PIAAALILKGMSPGAGFVFLFAGPATNTATLSFVGGKLGKKHLILYLTTILLCSVAFGALIDYVWISAGQDLSLISGAMEMLPEWLKIASALLLLALMLRPFVMRFISKPVSDEGLHFEVPDMNCEHCKKTITGALQQVDGVQNVNVMLSLRLVQVVGNAERNELENAIRNAGYNITDVR